MYRDRPVEPRVAALEALVAAGTRLRTQLVPVQIEIDALDERIAVLEVQLADLRSRQDAGLLATIGGWFGRSIEQQRHDLKTGNEELATSLSRVALLSEQERELQAKITASVSAGIELEAVRTRSLAALREAVGPFADELRALDIDDVRDGQRISAIVNLLDTLDVAKTATLGMITARDKLAENTDREQRRVRLADAIADAEIRLREVDASYDDAKCEWFAELLRADFAAHLGAKRAPLELVETTPLCTYSIAILDCLRALEHGLSETRTPRATTRRSAGATPRVALTTKRSSPSAVARS